MLFVKVLGVWLVMLVAAVANGAFRVAVLHSCFSPLVAHWIATITGCLLFVGIIWFSLPFLVSVKPGGVGDGKYSLGEGSLPQGPVRGQRLWALGAFWLVLTVAFEFLAGHYVFGNSWENLWADYNLFKGRLWLLVLATLLFAPVKIGKIRGIIS